jgi:hypothetical protein
MLCSSEALVHIHQIPRNHKLEEYKYAYPSFLTRVQVQCGVLGLTIILWLQILIIFTCCLSQ